MGELLPSVAADGLGLRIGLNFFLLSGPKFRYANASQAPPLGPPLSMSTFERLSRQILEIDEVTTGASLSTDTSPTTERIAPVKSWNKSRKKRAPVLSQELEPW